MLLYAVPVGLDVGENVPSSLYTIFLHHLLVAVATASISKVMCSLPLLNIVKCLLEEQ